MKQKKMLDIKIHNKKIIDNLNNFNLIDENMNELISENYVLFKFLILFHDIGKIYQNENHEKISAKLVDKYICDDFFLIQSKYFYLLIIENHTMLGSIFTGEGSINNLYNLEQIIKTYGINKSFFYKILIIFSTIDSWAYTDDISYAQNLYRNYKFIFKSYETFPKFINKFYNLKWRCSCFIGFYKRYNYWNIISTIKAYKAFKNSPNMCNIKIENLYNKNLKYAIWLINRFYYGNKRDCDKSNELLINYNNLFYLLLNDFLNNVELNEVYFINYRSPDICEKVFSKLNNKKYLNSVIKNKTVNGNQVYYDFNGGNDI